MFRAIIFFLIILPVSCLAQFAISGRVTNQVDKKPVANASVFLSNASVGSKTADDGSFVLHNAKPGKYDLVVSVIGFEVQHQVIVLDNANITLPPIQIFPKSVALKEVTIKVKTDPNRERNYELFKNGFLGTSELANECKILNPDVLDLDYDDTKDILTASSYDFLIVDNYALGYRIKYLLNNFTLDNKDSNSKNILPAGSVERNGFGGGLSTNLVKGNNAEISHGVNYEGYVSFENLKGTPSQERRWQRGRQGVYENSVMHFLRSAEINRIADEGFLVLKLAITANPERPSDSIINAKIKLYKDDKRRDSLSFWVKKSRLPKIFKKLIHTSLKAGDITRQTDNRDLHELFCDNGALYITYNKNHRFHINDYLGYLNDPRNTENSLVTFVTHPALFNTNGVITNPYSVLFTGVWSRNRVAEQLPLDYEAPQTGKMSDSTATEKAVARLVNFSGKHTTEKTYLQFDKPYYAAGDTIYFKAYLTLGGENRLSDQSGILHVDLINANNKIDQSIKLQVTDGVAWGDFATPDSLPKGNYRVRAYTQWMLNDGNGAYFDQTITIGSNLNNKISESSTARTGINASPDLQFFPEGGELVTGIKCKIAFKAVGSNGLGIDVKGVVVDNDNKEITTFASSHLGMGSFYLTPQAGRTYKAKLSYANRAPNEITLPVAENKGISLSINNDTISKASVRIEANALYYQENKNKDYSLVIYSGDVAATVTCKLDSMVITMDILKRKLHTGIATVTLFSPAGEPLCERLLFVQKFDQLNLAVNSNKTTYSKREKVNISINAKTRADEPTLGHFSVAVVDENKVPLDENAENTILSNLLLTSDLKGFVEQPGYYFNHISDKTLADLDLVMLTHGYRRFEWKQVLNNENQPLAYQPEKELEITGMAKSLSGNLLKNATVSLITAKDGSFTRTTTDDKGQFKFSNLEFADTTKFILQAINAKGKNTTKLTYNADAAEPPVNAAIPDINNNVNQQMTAYMENRLKQQEDLTKYGDIKGRVLNVVNIKGKKKEENIYSHNLVSPEFADQLIKSDQMALGGQFSDRIQGALHNVYLQTKGTGAFAFLPGSLQPMLVVVDGVYTDGDLNKINADDVGSVEVLKYVSRAAYGPAGAAGVLVINSKINKGLQMNNIASIGILPIAPKGFYKAREFYSPKYEASATANNRPDLRSTIYWNPELVTDKDGNASFDYYNADGPGTYRLIIEGIDDKGNIGRQVYRYKVE